MEALMRGTDRPAHTPTSRRSHDKVSGAKCPATQVTKLAPVDCPKFDKCSAPICPLDEEMLSRSHLAGEPVCLYLREYVKEGGEARLSGCIPTELLEAIQSATPLVIARCAPLKRQLARAARTPSKLTPNWSFRMLFFMGRV